MKKYFVLILATVIFALIPVSPARAWEGLIAPYCHGPDGECSLCDGIAMAKGFLDFLTFSLALPLAMLAVLIAGVQYTLGGANPALIGKAKNLLKNTAYGLAFMFCAWLIVNSILAAAGASAIQGAWNPGRWFVIKCM